VDIAGSAVPSRDLKAYSLARNTVKKYLTEPSYERQVSASGRYSYAQKLATWLGIETTKSRKQRRTLRQIHTASARKRRKPKNLSTSWAPSAHKECGSRFDGKLGSDFSGIQEVRF